VLNPVGTADGIGIQSALPTAFVHVLRKKLYSSDLALPKIQQSALPTGYSCACLSAQFCDQASLCFERNSFVIHTMSSMQTRVSFERKFSASSLFLAHCSDAERPQQSERRAADIVNFLCGAKLNRPDETAMTELLDAKAGVWNASDAERIMNAIVACSQLRLRRGMQTWTHAVLHIFTAGERERWRESVPEAMLIEIIARLVAWSRFELRCGQGKSKRKVALQP